MNFALARLLLVVSSAAVVWADDHANLGKLDWELMNACADGNASEVFLHYLGL